jgi:hypothetical protein
MARFQNYERILQSEKFFKQLRAWFFQPLKLPVDPVHQAEIFFAERLTCRRGLAR